MAASNPFAFRPYAVTLWTTVVYLALLIPLLIIHEAVPAPPSNPDPYPGINLTKLWFDLTVLSRDYHPFNSRANDDVHDWLLHELEKIETRNRATDSSIVVFADNTSNITTTQPVFGASTSVGTYFEGTNILVYIRGKDDPPGPWWEDSGARPDGIIGKGGVLMNAHYDSVASGYGATDDGMGCVTLLALVDYFSRSDNQPQRGIVALFNNNEEDGLWGAQAFANHPLLPFCHTFLNLEGAGAGGRATLFRSTDAEVTNAYKGSSDPFGSVVSSDAFGLGVIRSGTDFSVFNGVYGLRGLDVAFYRPRARYHTNQDDAAHASRASLWHMLSNSLHTVQGLSGDTGDTFIGARPDGDEQKVPNGSGSDGVWFDLFGKSFALFGLRTMFAWTVTMLVTTPLILFALAYALVRNDKFYLFSEKRTPHDELSDLGSVKLGGRKGIFRFPFALIVAGALVVGCAYLIAKFNPLVVYSNEYTVWAMMLSLFYFALWTVMAGANFARPSALHRTYSILWLFIISWSVLVANAVFEDRFRIAAGYLFVFLHAAVSLASIISLCELFALPTKESYLQQAYEDQETRDHIGAIPHVDSLISPARDELDADIDGDDEGEAESHLAPTETTPLVGTRAGSQRQTTFATTYRRSIASLINRSKSSENEQDQPYEYEQKWSANLPSWTWIPQFLILGPFLIILITQNGLLLVASVSQTGVDGSSLLLPYLLTAFLSILLFVPVSPFVHRVTHHIPTLLLLVFVTTLVYNLVAFPFAENSRYKIYFQQVIDLDTGVSKVNYVGLQEYVERTVAELPSAVGKDLECSSANSLRSGLATCFYDGSDILPNITKTNPGREFSSWLNFNITRVQGENRAIFEIDAQDSRSCAITFSSPISSFVVDGNQPDERFGTMPEEGLGRIKLYRRDWITPWKVDVLWKAEADAVTRINGRVLCSWDDVNTPGTIPAYDEGIKFAPTWVALSKLTTGLCEGSRAFET
ncbi:peptidase family M28 family [Durotheca rogersii]|uniref:peptidase family M28 family n=1 Tax=Durotheca rogersii TaxID=419775 RepID=UPI00221F0521|nr:peptidase family M28 family [Durotheca rogersii]KAI5865431.1 peptidase family M28 family [Durotheca rogersii]